MKKLFLPIVLLFPLFLSAQMIDSVLYQKTWIDQEERIINGYSVTKDFGQLNRNPAAYNFFPITAVSYKDLNQLIRELERKAEEEKWDSEKLRDEMIHLQDKASGGQLQIYISRYEEQLANFRWYFVIIRGEDDKGKLFEKELGYQAPQNPYQRGWWNYITLDLPIKLEVPFYVYLNQKNSHYLSDFRFHIQKPPLDQQDRNE